MSGARCAAGAGRRALRRSADLLVLMVVVALTLLTAPARASSAQLVRAQPGRVEPGQAQSDRVQSAVLGRGVHVQQPPDGDPVAVTLSAFSPSLPKPDDTLTITGDLANSTNHQVADSHLGVRIGNGGEITGHTEPVAALAPGETLPFTFKVPVSALNLHSAGDHTLTLALAGSDGTRWGQLHVRLPWYPPGTQGKPLDVAAVWPVTDTPHEEPVSLGEGDTAQPVFRDDELATEFADGGRLRQVVAAAAGLPVTWTVDPALLDEAQGMTGGYRVAKNPDSGSPQESVPGTGGTVASSWLTAIRAAVKDGSVVALPYADPDLASIARWNADTGALATILRDAVSWGGTTAAQTLHVSVRDDVAWPYAGALDTDIAALVQKLGPNVFLASGRGLSTGASEPKVSIGGGGTALVGDPAIDAVLTQPTTDAGDVATARQEILGDLLNAERDAPDAPGGLLVVPPRQMSASTAQALAEALKAAQGAGWAKVVGLNGVSNAAPASTTASSTASTAPWASGAASAASGEAPSGSGEASTTSAAGLAPAIGLTPAAGIAAPAGLASAAATPTAATPTAATPTASVGPPESYPQALRASELTADDLHAVAAIEPDLDTLSLVLSAPARTTDVVHRAMLRAVSTGWRVDAVSGDTDSETSYTKGVRAYVDKSITSVRLLPKLGTVTMAGDSASIPVTVSNGLQQPLSGLELRVTSSAADRVTIGNPTTAVRAAAEANHTVQVRARAHANGPVQVTAQLYTTANNRPWGDPITFQVRVSKISPLAIGVIAGGVLLVLLAGAFKMRQARRRQPPGDPAPGTPGPGPDSPERPDGPDGSPPEDPGSDGPAPR
ncbi:hypothetical protein K7472_03255 [Streptomyces sp. PTM05]|uniref:Glycoprotein n=1 Tax=Streptantibioticus parmotrematis TaxID=2873249 RepID=A0ABS7QL09_9ACTN|nr:hypothetical protein [Streptantibioticus parmotrematis]MBY8883858.1 hypothetical protein [Streptantibioticus parmotrematis]